MKRSKKHGGTRQKSYVTPAMKRTFGLIVYEPYPMAEIADEKTRTISMSSSFHSSGTILLTHLTPLSDKDAA